MIGFWLDLDIAHVHTLALAHTNYDEDYEGS
jgi:hypothetical protein